MIRTVYHKAKEIRQKIRAKYYTYRVRKRSAECGEGLQVNYKTVVSCNTYLGEHVNFNGMRIKGSGRVMIGRYFHSGTDCLILTHNHDYDGGNAIPYDSEHNIVKDVVIEDFVWLGDRVIILGGSHIGEGAIIQAGSVVCGEIPACGIAGGHPAKVFKYRNKEHFYELKEKDRFH